MAGRKKQIKKKQENAPENFNTPSSSEEQLLLPSDKSNQSKQTSLQSSSSTYSSDPIGSITQNKPFIVQPAKQDKGKKFDLRVVLVMILAALVVILAYNLFFLAPSTFLANEISSDDFKDVFSSSNNVFIVMDIRNAPDYNASNSVLQCGVDFAGSSGFGGKEVHYFAFSNEGCTTDSKSKGLTSISDCMSQLSSGLTIYISYGGGSARYYSNGMYVPVGSEYKLNSCGIKKL